MNGDSMDELVFHLGMPKTGSSALQVFLARNRDQLMARGVDYLPIGEFALGIKGRITAGNGAFLARTLLADNSPARIVEPERHRAEFEAAATASGSRAGLISSELFIDARREKIEPLIGHLRERGITAKALYYIRRHDQFLASGYMQQVKRHGCTVPPEVYARIAYKQHPFLKYHSYYRYLCELFRSVNVSCRIYDGELMQGSGLFRDVLKALDVPADGLDFAVPDVNTSLTAKDVAIMLLINRYQPRMQFSDLVVENAVAIGSMKAGMEHDLLPAALIEEVDEYFRAENQAMAREYFGRAHLFEPRPAREAKETAGAPELSPEDLINFFGGLLVRYDQRIAALDQRVGELGTVIQALRAELDVARAAE
ncbi:MAG: hypothetical protein ACREFS_04215 [Acetobacteraceae bacterium]